MSHLSLEERAIIENYLDHGDSIRCIAKELNRPPSTIKREIDRNKKIVHHKNDLCAFRRDCKKTSICRNCSNKNRLCKSCSRNCYRHCADYTTADCDFLSEPPGVCNGCNHKFNCDFEKVYYKAGNADKKYRKNLSDCRSGYDLTLEELINIDDTVSPLIKQGLSPYHISECTKDELHISSSTLYRLISSGELRARDIDLRDKVRRKPRKSQHRKMHNEVINAAKEGRKWPDYIKYINENDTLVVQMDCVEGTVDDEEALLTLHYPETHLQLAIILDRHDSKHVVEALDMIERAIGTDLFKRMFPVILTDNGQEFSRIEDMEHSCLDGTIRTKIFFCEPNRSDEKGACENNHKLIRYVIPKGTSLHQFNQQQISLMMNHINSYRRKALGGKSPYDLASLMFPEDFFILLGIERIPEKEIILTPKIFLSR